MSVERFQAADTAARRLVRGAALVVAVAASSHAMALGLGEPKVASVLGQPLQMTVPLVMEAGAELPQECVRIIPGRELGEPIPSLNVGRITVDAERRQLKIESLQPISEPTLRVVVELGCNERIRREFALLLDPPSVAPLGTDALARLGGAESPIGLGMAQISAVLGQRLSIRVPAVGTEAGTLSADCVRLADPISSEGAPVLRRADIRVLRQDAGALIEVVTPDPVTEPAVRLALDVGCREPLRREFAILLGLPALAASDAGAPVAAEEPKQLAPAPKPTTKRAAKSPRIVTAVPVAPGPAQKAPAVVAPAEAPAKAPQAAGRGSDRLVLGSPEELVKPAGSNGDVRAMTPDPSSELAKRLDTMSRQIEALQAQLNASRQREQDLERRASQTREQWTWSSGALGGLLLGGALVMTWRQRRPPARPDWEPMATTRPRPVTVMRPAATTPPSGGTASRGDREIGGRATMAPAPSTVGASTEPSMSDDRRSEITVTELHDTVQVIKELYATVLERSTSAATIPATGRPQRPLELDLRAPTVANPPAAPAVRRSESDRTDVSPPTQAEPTKHGSDERFTELPTEAGLDLDLTSVVAATGAGSERADVRPQLRDDPLARRTRQPVAGALSRGEPTPLDKAGAGRVPAATPPPPPVSTPSEARRAVDLSDEQLTQTPTELAIDIDVGTTTDFSSTIGRGAPAVAPARQGESERTAKPPSMLDPIDLQLDLPESKNKPRTQRSA